jgi:hypothetical protein
MAFFCLRPVTENLCGEPRVATVQNPLMDYDVTLGTPEAQGIFPPFTNLTAEIYEINGLGQGYTWNYKTGKWV